jgi:uncharacterized protein (TIGR02246 family)
MARQLGFLGLLIAVLGLVAFQRFGGPADVSAPVAAAEPPATTGPEEEAIRKAIQAYTAAYNDGNLDAILSYWSADPEFIDESGKSTRGREALTALFKKGFEDQKKGAKIKIGTKSLRILKPDVALQRGTVTITTADQTVDSGPFNAVWTKVDGKWLIAQVQDLPGEGMAGPSNFEALKQLDWLIGDWTSEGKTSSVTMSCKWTKNRNFLVVDMVVKLKDQDDLTLTQMIGWDASEQQVRSWVFDSHGGFGEGLWKRTGNRWEIDSTGVLADGRKASSKSTWKYVEADAFEWSSVDRQIDGRPMPDISLKYTRKDGKN